MTTDPSFVASLQSGLIRARYQDIFKHSRNIDNKYTGSTYLKSRQNINHFILWDDLKHTFDLDDPFSYINWDKTYLANEDGNVGASPTIVPNPFYGNVNNPTSNDEFITIAWRGYFYADVSGVYNFSILVDCHVHVLFKINNKWEIGVFVKEATQQNSPAQKENTHWLNKELGYVSGSTQLNLENGIQLPQGYTEIMILYGKDNRKEAFQLSMYGGNLGKHVVPKLLFYSQEKLSNIAITNKFDYDVSNINTEVLRNINSVAQAQSINTLVAVGSKRRHNVIIHSLDNGLTWNKSLDPSRGNTYDWINGEVFNVVWTGSKFIATTDNSGAFLISSNDGINWRLFEYQPPADISNVCNIANNGDHFVLTTKTGGNLAYFDNSSNSYTVSEVGVSNQLGCGFLNNRYIVCGFDSIIYSYNGVEWDQCKSVFNTNILGQTYDVAYGDGYWFATNDSYDIMITHDMYFPDYWNVIESDNTLFTGSDYPNKVTFIPDTHTLYVSIQSVNNSRFVKSTDYGATWIEVGDFKFKKCNKVIQIGSDIEYQYVSDLSNVFFHTTEMLEDISNGYNDSNPSG